MGLKDVSSVFSREFIVGYFAPAFFAAFAVALLLDVPPDRLKDPLESNAVLLLGAIALLLALVLNGLRHPITSVYSGHRLGDVSGLGTTYTEFSRKTLRRRRRLVAEVALKRLQAQYDVLQSVIARGDDSEDAKKIRDARLGEHRDAIAPTRFGTARAAVGSYAESRWGIDLWYVWPRVAPLIPEPEAALRRRTLRRIRLSLLTARPLPFWRHPHWRSSRSSVRTQPRQRSPSWRCSACLDIGCFIASLYRRRSGRLRTPGPAWTSTIPSFCVGSARPATSSSRRPNCIDFGLKGRGRNGCHPFPPHAEAASSSDSENRQRNAAY